MLVTTQDRAASVLFARKGADVLMTSAGELRARRRLGDSIVVPAPDGTKVRVKVPAGTQPGTVLSVKGKGAPRVKGAGNGDLKITLDMPVPTHLNDGQRKALEDYWPQA